MKQKQETKMFTYVKKHYKLFILLSAAVVLYTLFVFAKRNYNNADFGKSFESKAVVAVKKIKSMQDGFALCASYCHQQPLFLQSIVFPELMRYNQLRDDIESETLRTLYVQFGEAYANFSIGIFQMKPSFAAQVEEKVKQLLPDSTGKELQLAYATNNEERIRAERIERLEDEHWQLIYLTAFVLICNEELKDKKFKSEIEKLQHYATVYNAGFNKSDKFITKKITEAHFYLKANMPGKKFKYAAIAQWYFENGNN